MFRRQVNHGQLLVLPVLEVLPNLLDDSLVIWNVLEGLEFDLDLLERHAMVDEGLLPSVAESLQLLVMFIDLGLENLLHLDLSLDPGDDNLVSHDSTEDAVTEGHTNADEQHHPEVVADHYLNC